MAFTAAPRKKTSTSTKKRSGFVYRERDPEEVKRRSEQTGGSYDSPFKQGFDIYRPKPGDNLIRILPPTWDDALHYALDIWVHKFVGTDKSTYLCLQKMKNKPCPICAAAKEASEAGEEDDAKQLKAREDRVAWIIDRNEESKTPQLYQFSWSMDREITTLARNKRSGKTLWIDHDTKGYDVEFVKTGAGLKTRYVGIKIDREPSAIDEDEDKQEEILKFIEENPLPSVLRYYDPEYLEGMISGTAEPKDELDEDENEDEKPKKKKGRVANEEDEADDESEDEEDEQPKKKTHSRRAEPEEDEEDEEEEKPAKKRARRSEPEEDEEGDDEEEAPKKRSRRSEPEEDEDEEEDDTADETEDEDELEEEDEEDEAPKRKLQRTRRK